MLLKNGNVFDGEQFLEGMEVRLAGNIVTETGYDLQASDEEKIIDLAGYPAGASPPTFSSDHPSARADPRKEPFHGR